MKENHIFSRRVGGQFSESENKREALTLLEAYCASKNDTDPIKYFEQSPTGFGRKKFITERNAIVDSLAMVAHAFVDRSFSLNFPESGEPVGALMPHRQAVATLLASEDAGLYERILTSIQDNGEISAADKEAACRILGVEALMFVAVSYDFVQILHSSQYGSWFATAIVAETDAAVFGKDQEAPLAMVGFSQTHEEHLKGLGDIGKLVHDGLVGRLRDSGEGNNSLR